MEVEEIIFEMFHVECSVKYTFFPSLLFACGNLTWYFCGYI